MLDKIPFLKQSDFRKNVAIVFSGSVAAQFISIATAPIIARLYLPDQYGIFGVFLSIAATASVLPTLRYTQAIIITKHDTDARRLLQFCTLTAVFISILLMVLLVVFYDQLLSLVGAADLGNWILVLPPVVFLTAMSELYFTWLNRFKGFRAITISRILISAATVISYLIWAYFIGASFRGLIFGMFAAQVIGTVYLFFAARAASDVTVPFDWVATRPLLSQYRKFFVYSLPSDLITIFTNQLPVFMLNAYAGRAEVGYFNMSQRILAIPSTFVSTSVGEVFKQRASEDFHKTGSCRPIFLKTFKALALMGLPPFILIFLFGPWLFSIFLGSEWASAGLYSQILAVMFYLRFVNSPLSYVMYIVNKQQFDIIGVLVYNLVTVLVFLIGFAYFDTVTVLILYTAAFSVVYLAMFLLNYSLSHHGSEDSGPLRQGG